MRVSYIYLCVSFYARFANMMKSKRESLVVHQFTQRIVLCIAKERRIRSSDGPVPTLQADKKSPRAQDFEERLAARIVGQERAVRRMSGLYQIFLAGMNPPARPIGTMLFLGPTGSGKTRVIEAASEVLYGDPNGVVKIDCAEFQHSHEIAKLIGSPPGYLGHRETSPMLT